MQAAFDEMSDQDAVYHGYADDMRDHDIAIYATADTRTGIAQD